MTKPICNVHTHLFNAQYTPDNFIGLIVSFLSRQLTWAFKRRWTAKILIGILRLFGERSRIGKYVAFLMVGIKESQHKIFNDLRYNEGYPPGTRFVVLPLNFEHMGAGKVTVPYTQQLNDLIRVKATVGESLLPFVYIDPRMGTAEENRDFVKKYIELKGFAGIKLYPSLGYYPFDPCLELVYQYAADNGIPIMTHCSSTGIFYNDRNHIPDHFTSPDSFNRQEKDYFTKEDRSYQYQYPPDGVRKSKYLAKFTDHFLEPVNYTDALEQFPNLKICFAHFGLDNDQHHPANKLPWHEQIVELMRKYDNVFADISYSLHYKKDRERFVTYMKDERISKRILYGTDFFMTLQEVKCERELLERTRKSFGEDFYKIARDNMPAYLNSEFYSY